jgi:hypothetical protein
MNNNINNTVLVIVATVLFFLLSTPVPGQTTKNLDVRNNVHHNFAYPSSVTEKQNFISLFNFNLAGFEDDESSCEYLQEFPNVCVVLA